MNKLCLPLSLIGIAVVTVLAGCTGTSDETDVTATPTASASADSLTTGECVDGQALITNADVTDATASLPYGCETVYVLTDSTTIDLGPTSRLVFEGTGNTVTVTGDAPEIVGGDENTVTAAN